MKNIKLRAITLEDTANIVRWRNMPSVLKNFIDQPILTNESHTNYFNTRIKSGQVIQHIITVDGRDVGTAFLRDIDYADGRAEFGIFIGEEEYRGKGIGTKATQMTLDYAFNELKLKKVVLRVRQENEVGIRAYKKCGYYETGRKDGIIFMEIVADGQNGQKDRHVIVKNAVWEKQNLGVDTVEIICDAQATAEELEERLAEISADYSVLKIPCGRVELLQAGQQSGYRFVETLLSLSFNCNKDIAVSKIFERILKDTELVVADEKEAEQIISRVEDGNMFVTDRIATDLRFGKALAGKRYANWMRQLITVDHKLIEVKVKGKAIGFGITTYKDVIADAVLGGVYPEYDGRGLGWLSLYANTLTPKERGCKKVTTHVSSNNMGIIKLHQSMGYEIEDAVYVLIKHGEKKDA